MQLVAYGAAVVAAAFMLAWACEAAQADVARGAVVAAVAFVAILPEYIVEVHFAFTGRAEYVTANLTGASRLLLGVCVALPAVVAAAAAPLATGPHRAGSRSLRRSASSSRSSRSPRCGRCAAALTGRLTLLDARRAGRASTRSTCAGRPRPRARRRRPMGVAAELVGAARRPAAPLGRAA